jgi:glycine cleavage system H protein
MKKVGEKMRYSKSHEWIIKEGDVYVVGITEHAAKELGDVVYVELPTLGQKISVDKSFGVVESVKSVSDLISPLSGEVVAVNADLEAQPELVNQDTLGKGWMMKVKASNESEFDVLLTKEQYDKFISEEK